MSKGDYINKIQGAERRWFTSNVTVEHRTEDDNQDTLIEGYAALFNSRTDLGWMEEEILPGAFDEVLQDDVRCLFNHNPNFVLARTTSGTLSLEVDSKGLKYKYTTPDRTYARDLADAISKGDVSQSSFAFSVEESIWVEREDGKSLRQIKKLKRLYDVAPVTYPAYGDTSVAKRSFKEFQDSDETKIQENEERFDVYDAQLMLNKNRFL